MTASDYPITFPYGATDPPYSPRSPHRGDDRPTPTGTTVVIAGQTIGLTGATGKVTGPHLHIQEWQGSPANTRKPQNAFKPGTVTAATSSSDFGNYITVTSDGWNTSYCHLSQINVKVGQILGGKRVIENNAYWRDFLRIIHSEMGGWDYTKTHNGEYDKIFMDAWYGRTPDEAVWSQWNNGGAFRGARLAQEKAIRDLNNALNGSKAELKAAQDAVVAANAKVAEESKKATEAGQKTVELEAEKQADTATGNSFLRWIGNILRGGK